MKRNKKHGVAEGIEAGKNKAIVKLLKKGLSVQKIQKMSALPLDFIIEVQKKEDTKQ
jgi:hypothetical protein